MTTYAELIAKYDAEEVGNRLIALVDGQKQYIANKEAGGGFSLTYHGMKLEEQSQAAPVEEKPAAKPRKKREVDAAADDLLAGLDAE